MTDWELLHQFAREGSQAAFAELVARHLNFVYATARRQVRSPAAAEEVAQSVFLELARHAGRLDARTPLACWLHVVTRRRSRDWLRAEMRRRGREHAAWELSAMNESTSPWEQVEPLLDEALASLPGSDRAAILLRYFEGRSLREIGDALGASEDAVQKRVSRALERLRALLLKQGATVSAAGLAAGITTHSLEAAPVSLGSSIATAVANLAPGSAATAGLFAAMTTIQKSALVAVTLAVTGIFVAEISALAEQEDRLGAVEGRIAELRANEVALRIERNEAVGQLALLRAPESPRRPAPALVAEEDPVIAELNARIERLEDYLADHPSHETPEMKLLTQDDWLAVVRQQLPDTDSEVRIALGQLRSIATSKFASRLSRSLTAYVETHDGRMPRDINELAAGLPDDLKASNGALDRYRIGWTGLFDDAPADAVLIEERTDALADPDYDIRQLVKVIRTTARPDNIVINFGAEYGPSAVRMDPDASPMRLQMNP